MKLYFVLAKTTVVFASTVIILFSIFACRETVKPDVKGKIKPSGKPAAPIFISDTAPEKAAMGQELSVTVEFKIQKDADNLVLKVTPGKGLRIVGETFLKDYGNKPANTTFSETLEIVTEEEGLLYINVFVSGTFSGKRMTRAGAIPINVGGNQDQKLFETQKRSIIDSKGNRITIMPAEENR